MREQPLGDHWNDHAERWRHVGPPLRPCDEDVELLRDRISRERPVPATAVLLGVTPEIAGLDWPTGTHLIAVDRSRGMIEGVWPFADPASRPDREVRESDWTMLPLEDASCQLVVGDGCFTLLRYPDQQAKVLDEVARVLAPGGAMIMRYFARLDVPEPMDRVVGDLRAGRIGNFHILKWRLAMALHGPIETGVSVGEIWRAFEDAVPDRQRLADEQGWPRASIDTIDVYRDVDTPYFYPTLEEMAELTQGHFDVEWVVHPDYELGDRCPTVGYRRPA